MAYTIQLAATDSYGGITTFEFNLTDPDDIFPATRVAKKIKKNRQDISEPEIEDLKQEIISVYSAIAQTELDKEADLEFMQQFIPLVEGGLEALRLELLNKVKTENNLSESQIKIAENVIFSWKVNE